VSRAPGPQRTVTVTAAVADPAGLHVRPCSRIAQAVEAYQSAVWIAAGGREVGAISILGLLELGVPCGAHVTVRAVGPDAEACAAAVVAILRDEGHAD